VRPPSSGCGVDENPVRLIAPHASTHLALHIPAREKFSPPVRDIENASARVLLPGARRINDAARPSTPDHNICIYRPASPPFEFARNVIAFIAWPTGRIASGRTSTSLKVTFYSNGHTRLLWMRPSIAIEQPYRHCTDILVGRKCKTLRSGTAILRAAPEVFVSSNRQRAKSWGASSYGLTVRHGCRRPLRSRAGRTIVRLYGHNGTIHRPGELVKSYPWRPARTRRWHAAGT